MLFHALSPQNGQHAFGKVLALSMMPHKPLAPVLGAELTVVVATLDA